MTTIHNDTPVQLARNLGVTWQEPPKSRRGGGLALPWVQWCNILRSKPGAWAKLYTFESRTAASTQCTRWRKKDVGADIDDREDFEFRGSKDGDNGSALYGRYLGD